MVSDEVVMNSKDRRKNKRQFPFTVETKRLFVNPYDDYYDRQTEIDQWCNKQLGKGNWKRNSSVWYINIYKFKLEKDKIWFALRWS
jgi:hypothetical protein